MHYLWYHLTRDFRFWLKIVVIPGLAILALMDVLTSIFNPPGLSNFKIVFALFALSILALFTYGIHLYRAPREERRVRGEQAVYERQREAEFREIIAVNRHFETHCYTCRHQNPQTLSCSMDIRNLQARSVKLNGPFSYCLYWEKRTETC